MFLVLLPLLWWRARLGDDVGDVDLLGWKESVKDVTKVLECLKGMYSGASDEVENGANVQGAKRGTKRK